MSKIYEPATDFKFTPADFVPFKDRELCEKLRKISGTDLEKHPNPNFKIKVMMNPHPAPLNIDLQNPMSVRFETMSLHCCMICWSEMARDISKHPTILSRSMISSMKKSSQCLKFFTQPVYNPNLKWITDINPMLNMIAPMIPPTFK